MKLPTEVAQMVERLRGMGDSPRIYSDAADLLSRLARENETLRAQDMRFSRREPAALRSQVDALRADVERLQRELAEAKARADQVVLTEHDLEAPIHALRSRLEAAEALLVRYWGSAHDIMPPDLRAEVRTFLMVTLNHGSGAAPRAAAEERPAEEETGK